MSQFFASGGQRIGVSASASVLPMNIHLYSWYRWPLILLKLTQIGDVHLWHLPTCFLLHPLKLCCCCCEVASVVSDSVQPHRRQPNRLHHPWDSPGKNTGVGCHCLLRSQAQVPPILAPVLMHQLLNDLLFLQNSNSVKCES